jgi:hypothetical protein
MMRTVLGKAAGATCRSAPQRASDSGGRQTAKAKEEHAPGTALLRVALPRWIEFLLERAPAREQGLGLRCRWFENVGSFRFGRQRGYFDAKSIRALGHAPTGGTDEAGD